MRATDQASCSATQAGCAEQLARFFPGVRRMRLPVEATALRAGNKKLHERVVVEFAGKEHAIFLSTLPIEFDDLVRLVLPRESDSAEATVIAVQYHEGHKAVAVKFLGGPCRWVGRP